MPIHTLGPFRLDTQHDLLLREGAPVPLGRRAIALLRTLVEQPGILVSKDALIEAAWSGRLVEESNLSVQIAALRRVLGAAAGGHRWIETMPGRGYRFIGPIVTEMDKGAMAAPPQVDAAPEPAPTPRADAERRQITALSCELSGISGGANDVALEDLREVVAAFQRCVSETVDRHDGSVVSRLGNAALVLFGYPVAHEYDAEQAVRAALELCAAVRTLRSGADLPVRCRVGIATGMTIIGDANGDGVLQNREIVGDVPNLAGRLQLSVQPDVVAIEPVTRRLIGNLFDCRDLGTIDTPSGAKPLRIWQVLEDSVIANRFEALRGLALSPLVGRDEEMDVLLRRWASAKAGDGQVVLASGEPGLGKSRLTAALEERLCAEPHFRLRYFCSPYHQDSALYPLVEQLGRAAGFARNDMPTTKLEKLEVLLAPAALPEEDVALLAELMSLPASERHPLPNLSPQRKKERTLEALIRQLEGLAHRQPVLMVFEDVHWIDPTSRELLDLTVECVRRLPILLIVTFRPEFQPHWVGQPRVAMLALNRLDRRDRVALVAQIAGKALPEIVIEEIADRTDGVPLFVEELTKSVLESGLLREETSRYVLDGALPPFTIPTTLHASLLARLDRPGSVRLVAQTGAAIGREFSYALLRAVSDLPEDDLQTGLAGLAAAELVFQRGTPPEAVYSFKHALVQDAAHGSLLRNARQQLHARIAQALETHFPELVDTQPELFAQHYAEAGLIEQSVAYWGKSGDQALRRSGFKEAAAHFGKAIELADKLAATAPSAAPGGNRLRLQTSLGNALIWAKGHQAPETSAAFARARELASQVEDPSERFSAYYGLWAGYFTRSEPAPLREMAELFLHEGTARPDCPEALVAHRISGQTRWYFGDFAGAHDHFRKTIEFYDPACHGDFANRFGVDPRAAAEIWDAVTLWALGRIDEALPLADRALADAESAAHAPTMGHALAFAAVLGLVRYSPEAVATYSQALAEIVSRHDLPVLWAGTAEFCKGWIRWLRGDGESGLAEMRKGIGISREQGLVWFLPAFEAALAEAEVRAGETDAGLRCLDDALAELERTEERWYAAEIHRIRGEILLKRDPANTATAEQSLQTAIAIAQSQKARSFELRAAMSLARILRDQGRHIEARDLLAPVYGWFTEGFDTQDLKDAKALLDCIETAPAVSASNASRSDAGTIAR